MISGKNYPCAFASAAGERKISRRKRKGAKQAAKREKERKA